MWLLLLLVPEARSDRSSTATEMPLRAASRATPRPMMPPPRTTRSYDVTRDVSPCAMDRGASGPTRATSRPARHGLRETFGGDDFRCGTQFMFQSHGMNVSITGFGFESSATRSESGA